MRSQSANKSLINRRDSPVLRPTNWRS